MITLAQMKAALNAVHSNIKGVGAQEAPDMRPKTYISPVKGMNSNLPPGGVSTPSGLPIGGVDMSRMQPGQQMMPQQMMQPGQPPGGQMPGAPPQGGPEQAGQQAPSNILQMTQQGRAMAAMTPPQGPQPPQQGMADGGGVRPGRATMHDARRAVMEARKAQRVRPEIKQNYVPSGTTQPDYGYMQDILKAQPAPAPAQAPALNINQMAARLGVQPGEIQNIANLTNQGNVDQLLNQGAETPEYVKNLINRMQYSATAPSPGKGTYSSFYGYNPTTGAFTGDQPGGYSVQQGLTELYPGQKKAKGGSVEDEVDEESKMLAQMLMGKYRPTSQKASEALGQHEGKTMHVTQSDRTKVGEGFLGGPGFSSLQHIKPEYAGAAWGVNHPAVASSIINANARSPKGKAIWSTMIGSPSQHTSNQMVFDMMKKKFKAGIKAGKLSPELRAAINQQLSLAATKDGKKIFEGGADIASKNFFDTLNTFDKRRVMADLFGGIKVGGKKGQIFDYGKILEETTEPELRGAPTFAIGPRLFTVSGERSKRPDLHPAFPHIVHGEDLGVLYHPVPKEIMLPDFHEKIKKEKGRKVGYMDLVRNTPSQFLSEEFLTKLQKQGYKKGGTAKSMDSMRLELTKRGKGK